MNIILTYKLKTSEEIHEIILSTKKYFTEISDEENYEYDGIAKHDLEKYYIVDEFPDFDISSLDFTTIQLMNSKNSDFITKTTYFGNDSEVIYRRDKSGYELIIQSIRVAKNCIVITRMERPNYSSEWVNINLNVGVNDSSPDTEKEKWFSAKNGEFINSIISY